VCTDTAAVFLGPFLFPLEVCNPLCLVSWSSAVYMHAYVLLFMEWSLPWLVCVLPSVLLHGG
jgi:hypothetical protein